MMTQFIDEYMRHRSSTCYANSNNIASMHYQHSGDKIDGLLQDCSNSIANALELLQFCTKPSKWN